MVHDVDAEAAEQGLVADAGELQQLRGVDGAAAQDDLAGVHRPAQPAAAQVVDADRALALEAHGRQRQGLDVEVLPVPHGVQVGAGGGQPPAAVEVAVELREALLAVAVDVVGQRVARLLHGVEERREERVLGRAALEHERAVAAAPVVGAGRGRSPSA